MRFFGVMLGLLCLPALILAIMLAPLWVPVLFVLALAIPGLTAFRRTSGRGCWNIAAYHSPHSLTWRWLLSVSFDASILVKPFAHYSRDFFGPSFGFGLGILSGHIYRSNGGWQFAGNLMGMAIHLQQQRPMWYRNLYQRARDEADQLSGRLWVSDRHPHNVVPPTTVSTVSLQ